MDGSIDELRAVAFSICFASNRKHPTWTKNSSLLTNAVINYFSRARDKVRIRNHAFLMILNGLDW